MPACRVTGVSKTAILKLLADVGEACAAYQDRVMRNLKCKRLQCDEIWAFCTAKQRNVRRNKRHVAALATLTPGRRLTPKPS